MSRDIAPFGLRMPAATKEHIEQSAKSNGRSMNAEIVHRLEASFVMDADLKYTASIRPSLPANMARKAAGQNEELGLPSMLSDAINEKILAACTIGITTVEFDIAEFFSSYKASPSMAKKAITLVQEAYEHEGYSFTVNDKRVIVSF